ncbi:unnamed protein product, partial [Ixodes hexagonus]
VADFTKPNKYGGSAYNAFKHLLQMYRLTGCCPIDGLWQERLEDLRIHFRGYSLYTSFCMLLAICTFVEVMADSGSRRNLEAKTNLVVSVVFFAQSMVNLVVMMSRSAHFVLLLNQCALFESKRPAPRALVRKMKWLMVSRVIYCVVFFTPLVTRRIHRTVVARGVFEFVLRLSVTIGALYILFWSSIAESTLVMVAHLLKGYLGEVIKNIRAHEATVARLRSEHQWVFLRKTRQDIRDLRVIVQTANETIQLGILLTYGAAMACSCCSAFYVITTETALELLMKVMAIGYVVQTFLTIAVASHSSQSVTEKAREVKESLETFGKQRLPRKVTRLLMTVQLCLDPNCFSFNACGFFTVELSIFQAVSL